MTIIIDGKSIANKIQNHTKDYISQIRQDHKIYPGIAVILVGSDTASQVYVRNKINTAKLIGMDSIDILLPANVSEEILLSEINKLNNDSKINAILVQLPLPKHINSEKVIFAIDPKKDVDGFHPINVGKFFTKRDNIYDELILPCTPFGCLHLIKSVISDISGKKAIVIGDSNIVGRPMARLLLNEKCTVTIANSKTLNLKDEIIDADIIVSAAGRQNLINGDMIKSGAVIIDVGINRIDDSSEKGYKLVGDVNFDSSLNKAYAITPVPGGVGPMTIAMLMKNCLDLFRRQHKL